MAQMRFLQIVRLNALRLSALLLLLGESSKHIGDGFENVPRGV